MLLIMFKAGDRRYAIAGRHIIEVVPYLLPGELPGQPDFIPGVINYRGSRIPVVDLGILLADKPCRRRLSTRIILITYDQQTGKHLPSIIGLLAEEVTESLNIPTPENAGIIEQRNDNYDGRQYIKAELAGHKMLQLFEPGDFLPASTLQSLAL